MKGKTIAVGLAAALCLSAIGIVAIAGIKGAYNANLTSERSKLSAAAQVTAAFVAKEMDGVGELEKLTLTDADFVAALGSGHPTHEQLTNLQVTLAHLVTLESNYAFASVFTGDGTLLAISPPDPTLVDQNFDYRDWYVGVMRTGATYVSNAYVSAVAGSPHIVGVGTPIYAASPTGQRGAMIGILLIGYKIASVQAFVTHLSTLQQIGLQLADQQGTLMTTVATVGNSVDTTEGPAILAAEDGRSITTLSAGILSAGATVPGIGWSLSLSTPLAETTAGAGSQEVTAVAIGLLVALGLGGCAIVIVMGRLERAYARREATENKLQTVQESMTDGIIVYDAAGRLSSMNLATHHLFELEPGEQVTASVARCDLLREDGTALPAGDSPVITMQQSGPGFEGGAGLGVRSRANQTVRWLSFSTSPIHDAHSRVSGYVSTIRDVTDRLETIHALRIVSSAAAQMSSTLVGDRVIAALTKAASELCSATGEPRRRAELFIIEGPAMTSAGKHDPDDDVSMDGASYQLADHPYAQQVIASRQPAMAHLEFSLFGPSVAKAIRRAGVTNCVWVPLIRDGEVFAILAVAGRQNGLISPAILEYLKGIVAMGVLALDNAALHETVGNLARTDPLTGTANRRALAERVSQLPRVPFAFVAVDVDGLKPVNDTHGHSAGDELLAAVASAMQTQLRSADVLARTGGDEFVVLMVGSDAHGASELAGRLVASVSQVRLSWGIPSISVGAAAGMAGDDPAAVAERADEALYAAKQLRPHTLSVVGGSPGPR